ncbi:hypothetical protein IV81_GL001716 [Pediococcus stilesii]|uniref:Uncharacterized protein n=1 Tax=Pediococcus stilesii TaxID=331679 RepID=A0A0R2KX84_9LACO|nr:hypothetical protein IV81_GL001716 [Pediococcus stilesii]
MKAISKGQTLNFESIPTSKTFFNQVLFLTTPGGIYQKTTLGILALLKRESIFT